MEVFVRKKHFFVFICFFLLLLLVLFASHFFIGSMFPPVVYRSAQRLSEEFTPKFCGKRFRKMVENGALRGL